jgi:ribosomal protein S18 acetylase RimI-like enzyme
MTSSDDALDLRPATPEDAGRIRELVRAAYAKWVPVIGREPRPMTADYDAAVRAHEIDLLCAGNDLLAVLELIIQPDHLWIENIAVAPDRQGQGLGRHLLVHAERKAAALGLAELRLLTNGAFAANIALYRSVGFSIDRTEPFLNGTTVYMSKRIG